MRIAFVTEGIPRVGKGGGALTTFSAVLGLASNNHDVTILNLYSSKEEDNEIDQTHKNLGVNVKNFSFVVPKTSLIQRIKRIFFAKLNDFFPSIKNSNDINEHLKTNQYDVVIAYHWHACASLYKLTGNYKKIYLVGDPTHLPNLIREKYLEKFTSLRDLIFYLEIRLINLFTISTQINMMRKILNDADFCGAFSSFHANEFKQSGVMSCKYFKTPTPEVSYSEKCKYSKKFKITLIGRLAGIATISGIEIFNREIYPVLKNRIPIDNFEVHVIGDIPKNTNRKILADLERKNIILRGQIHPADCEFQNSDIILVPTPIKLGIRVRIITAFSHGCLVVSHSANKFGIPEMKDKFNCLLGDNGKEIADQIINVYLKKFDVNRIRHNSKLTYLENFTPGLFERRIKSLLEPRL